MKSVYIYSNGCSSNMLDGERISRYFGLNGYSFTHVPDTADIIVVNTCAFESRSERDSLEKIKELQKHKHARMIVCGCLPAINKYKLDEVYNGDYFIPRDEENWGRLDEIIHPEVPITEIKDPSTLSHRWKDWKLIGVYRAFKENQDCKPIKGYDEDMYHIRISSGCSGSCSFCGIRFARGYIRSKPVEEITDNIMQGLKQGYKFFKVWGDDVGDYGVDVNTNLSVLLSEILKIKGDFKLEVLAMNPKRFLELYESLAPILEDPRVKWLNISIQSGSRKILKLMNRGIDLYALTSALKNLKKRAPHLIVRAHYIVGFPQEGWRDFLSTMIFTFRVRIFKYLVWTYDPKPNTQAAEMPGQASRLRKKAYYHMLKAWGSLWSFMLEDGETY